MRYGKCGHRNTVPFTLYSVRFSSLYSLLLTVLRCTLYALLCTLYRCTLHSLLCTLLFPLLLTLNRFTLYPCGSVPGRPCRAPCRTKTVRLPFLSPAYHISKYSIFQALHNALKQRCSPLCLERKGTQNASRKSPCNGPETRLFSDCFISAPRRVLTF